MELATISPRWWRRTAVAVALLAVTLSGAAPAAASGAEHPHHVALFAGATSFETEWTPHFTVGADYEFRLPFLDGLLGIFASGEVVVVEGTPLIFTAGLTVHPIGGLKILAGAGTEFHAEHPEPEFLVRGGLGYDFHLGMISLGPAAFVDYADGHVALVYGLSAGVVF